MGPAGLLAVRLAIRPERTVSTANYSSMIRWVASVRNLIRPQRRSALQVFRLIPQPGRSPATTLLVATSRLLQVTRGDGTSRRRLTTGKAVLASPLIRTELSRLRATPAVAARAAKL